MTSSMSTRSILNKNKVLPTHKCSFRRVKTSDVMRHLSNDVIIRHDITMPCCDMQEHRTTNRHSRWQGLKKSSKNGHSLTSFCDVTFMECPQTDVTCSNMQNWSLESDHNLPTMINFIQCLWLYFEFQLNPNRELLETRNQAHVTKSRDLMCSNSHAPPLITKHVATNTKRTHHGPQTAKADFILAYIPKCSIFVHQILLF